MSLPKRNKVFPTMGQKEFYSVTGWNVYSENNITKMPLHNSILKINIKYNS